METAPILPILDTIGIFVFGLTGGTLAVRRELDLFGVITLAMVTALAGGVGRDILLDTGPPAALVNVHYLWSALASGLAAFFFHRPIERLGKPVMVLDALGLGLFAVAGCRKALDLGLAPLPAILLGVMTAVGGGMTRDVLVGEIPRVLREDIYASAALLAALIVTIGDALDIPRVPVAIVGIAAAFALRMTSQALGWRAPRAPGS